MAQLASLGIEFQKEKEANEDERSSVALLCAGLLKRGMVCKLERTLHDSDRLFSSKSVTFEVAVLLWQW